MSLFGSSRDVSLFRNISRELMGNIISQQCFYYKHNLEESDTNIYGEASKTRVLNEPVILPCIIKRNDQEYTGDVLGVDFVWGAEFSFLSDDLNSVSSDMIAISFINLNVRS